MSGTIGIYLWMALCCLLPVAASGQAIKGYIGGTVRDESGRKLWGATVRLISIPTGKAAAQAWADEQGHFRFGVDTGRYRVFVSSIGYLEQRSDTITLGPQPGQSVNLAFSLKSAVKMLQDVVVSAQPSNVRTEGGKLVLNTANALSAGTSAMELLKSMPGVTIGQDDEILFRGSPGIQVTLNGKMTYLSGKELAKMLNGLSAADISKIELLASPSADFDAAGSAGVINLVTRKQQEKGYAIELRSTASKGKYWMVNEHITGRFKTAKLNAEASLDYNTPHRYTRGSSSNAVTGGAGDVMLGRESEVSYKVKFYTYKINAVWQPYPRHQITAGYSGYTDDFTAPKSSSVKMHDGTGRPVASVYSKVDIIEPYYFDALNAGYQFDIDSSGKQLTADAHLINYRNYSTSRMESLRFDGNGDPENNLDVLRSDQPGFIHVYAYKADVLLPYPWLTIKAGIKYSLATNDNRANFDSLQNGHYVPAPSLSNHFTYRESISAAYAAATKTWNKTVFNVGLRLEQTRARSQSAQASANNRWNYTRLFPSLSVDMEIDADNQLNLALSRRIERPPYSALNPVRWYQDPYYMFAGNPFLQPETGWLYAATYTWKRRYILMLNYSAKSNYLSRGIIKDTLSPALINWRANFDNYRRFDASIAASWPVTGWWKMQWNAGLSYTTYPVDQQPASDRLSQWAGNIQCIHQLRLPWDISMELAGYWYSRELLGVFRKDSYGYLNAGLERSFFRKALGVRLAVNDVFFTNNFRAWSLAPATDYRYFDRPDTRRIMLSLRYNLGGKLQPVKARSTEEQDRL